jgi:hypothetical protein
MHSQKTPKIHPKSFIKKAATKTQDTQHFPAHKNSPLIITLHGTEK